MRFTLAALFSVFLVAACQTPCPAPPSGPVRAHFSCEDGAELNVTFTRGPDLARIEEEGYTTLTLESRIAGTGYTYSGGGAELRRRGAETTWTRPGGAPTICSETRDDEEASAPVSLPRQAMSMGAPSNCPGANLADLRLRAGMSRS